MFEYLTKYEIVALIAHIANLKRKSIGIAADLLAEYSGDTLTIKRDGYEYRVIQTSTTMPVGRYLMIPPTFKADYFDLLH